MKKILVTLLAVAMVLTMVLSLAACNNTTEVETAKEKDLSNEEYNLVLNTVNNDAYVMRELALEEVRKEIKTKFFMNMNDIMVNKHDELKY